MKYNFIPRLSSSALVVALALPLNAFAEPEELTLQNFNERVHRDLCKGGVEALPQLSMHHEVNFYSNSSSRLTRRASTVLVPETGGITKDGLDTPWTRGGPKTIAYSSTSPQESLNWGIDFKMADSITPTEVDGLKVIHGHPILHEDFGHSVKLKGRFMVINAEGENVLVDTGDCKTNKGKFKIHHLYIDSSDYTSAYISFENWCSLHEDKSDTKTPYWVTTTGLLRYNFCPEQLAHFAAAQTRLELEIEETFSEVGTEIDNATDPKSSTTTTLPPAKPCIDSDGDGWGWDGNKSCIPEASPACARIGQKLINGVCVGGSG